MNQFYNYSFNGIPIFTLGAIGLTAFVLASITIYESTKQVDTPLLNELPTVASLNPLTNFGNSTEKSSDNNINISSGEEIKENKNEDNNPNQEYRQGGKTKKHKKQKHHKKTKTMKHSSKKSKK